LLALVSIRNWMTVSQRCPGGTWGHSRPGSASLVYPSQPKSTTAVRSIFDL